MLFATAETASTEEGLQFMQQFYPDTYQGESGLRIARTLERLFQYTTDDALYVDFDVSYENFFLREGSYDSQRILDDGSDSGRVAGQSKILGISGKQADLISGDVWLGHCVQLQPGSQRGSGGSSEAAHADEHGAKGGTV